MSYADEWNKKINQPSPVEKTMEMEFAGLKGVFRRVNLQGWMKTGRMPFFIIEAWQALAKEGGDSEKVIKQGDIDLDELKRGFAYQKSLVMEACVDPKIVDHDGPLNPGEVRYADVAEKFPEAIDQICTWQAIGCPEIPVQMTDGTEGKLADVTSFRNRKQRRGTAATRNKVPKVRKSA
jgi:hypothetical protein